MSEPVRVVIENSVSALDVAFNVLPWVTVIIGWIVVEHFQQKRDRKARHEALVNSVKHDLRALESKAIDYHRRHSPDVTLAVHIKSLIKRIAAETRSKQLLLDRDSNLVKDLRQAITLDNFDTVDFTPQGSDSPIFQEIGAAIEAIEDALERKLIRID